MITEPVYHYFDYKSPYAYLAQADTYLLQSQYGLDIHWCPYTLDIPSYLGNAMLDERGNDIVGSRNAHQWRRVKYSYMDCRREANLRGLTIRGPKKIFDSTIAHMGFLYVSKQANFRAYHDEIFRKFWCRELNIEEPHALKAIMTASGYDASGFDDYCHGDGQRDLRHTQERAEESGVFGVPSYLYKKELYWGLERIPRLLATVLS